MKNLRSLLSIFLLLIFTTCDKPDIIPITGDAFLQINNKCEYLLKIYFDDIYLGDVPADDENKWSVLSGLHSIKATCQGASAYEETHEFVDDQITILDMDIVITFKSKEIERIE